MFWSVTGAASGPIATTVNPPPIAAVGNADIVAKAWYLEAGGGGNGGPGVFVDAFDVALGTFVDDDFVSIHDANHAVNAGLSTSVNNTGFLPTTALKYADAFASIHSVPFADWTVVAGSEPVAGTELTAALNSSGIAFAFYLAPVRQRYNIPQYEVGTWVSWGVTVDGGGPTGNGPVPPWNPYVLEIAAGLALADAASKVSPQLRRQVLNIASEQIAVAAKGIREAMSAGFKE